jgi:hypothetical protein
MIGVTIGTGEPWKAVAEVAAKRMTQMTGLECVVIDERFKPVCHPSWLKCHVIDHFKEQDSFLLFDADIIAIKKWNPQQLFESLGRPFCAVPDMRSDIVFEECNQLGIAFPDCYVNGGLTMFGREHKVIWENTWRRHPKCGRWLEQGALNLALLDSGCEICRMPRRFNVLTYRGATLEWDTFDVRHTINLHVCGTACAQEVKEVQLRYGMYDSPEQNRATAQDAETVGVR